MKYDPVSSARDEKKNQYISMVSIDINKAPTEVDQIYIYSRETPFCTRVHSKYCPSGALVVCDLFDNW